VRERLLHIDQPLPDADDVFRGAAHQGLALERARCAQFQI
jgi:hypothetical protein